MSTSTRFTGMTADAIDRALTALGRASRRLTATIARGLLEMKRRRLYLELGSASIEQYAKARFGYSNRKTRDLIAVATAAECLPGVREAFDSGAAPWTKLR